MYYLNVESKQIYEICKKNLCFASKLIKRLNDSFPLINNLTIL